METKREEERIEAELKRQIGNLKDGPGHYTWDEWFQICTERMRVEMIRPTLMGHSLDLSRPLTPLSNVLSLCGS